MMDTSLETGLQRAIENHEFRFGSKFKPSKQFYTEKGINRIRFWQLAKGKKDITGREARVLAEFFSVPVTDLL